MKKRISVFALILLLAMALCVPAQAIRDYGVIYDETEMLGSDTLTMQGEETLPELSEALGIDLRVDVLTVISSDSIGEAAADIYDSYEYGYGENKEGITLTILLEPLETGGYAMAEDGWCIYVSLNAARGDSQELANTVRDAVEPYMVERAWNGKDMNMSAVALTQAVDAMAVSAEAYILENCPPAGADVPETPETPETPEAPEQSDAVDVAYVFDTCELLSYEEWQYLEARAADISKRQHCGVYFVIVNDFTDYGDGSVFQVTYQLYHDNEFGVGDDRDGIIVLLSMEERDYAMFVYGEYAEYAFDEFGQEKLEERFLEDFGNDDWNGGISAYLDACDEFLTKAAEGKPVRPNYIGWYLIMTGLSCVAAGFICFLLLRSMKTVRSKDEADAYVTQGGLNLTMQRDQYERTVVTRRKIEKGGSGSSESGGGGSGRSGKF